MTCVVWAWMYGTRRFLRALVAALARKWRGCVWSCVLISTVALVVVVLCCCPQWGHLVVVGRWWRWLLVVARQWAAANRPPCARYVCSLLICGRAAGCSSPSRRQPRRPATAWRPSGGRDACRLRPRGLRARRDGTPIAPARRGGGRGGGGNEEEDAAATTAGAGIAQERKRRGDGAQKRGYKGVFERMGPCLPTNTHLEVVAVRGTAARGHGRHCGEWDG